MIILHIINESVNIRLDKRQRDNNEIWYIVNNSDDESYCFPVAIIRHHAAIAGGCLRKEEIEFLNRFNSIKKIQVQIDEYLLDYDDSIMKQVFEHSQKKPLNFQLQLPYNQKYEIDLIKKTQKKFRDSLRQKSYIFLDFLYIFV